MCLDRAFSINHDVAVDLDSFQNDPFRLFPMCRIWQMDFILIQFGSSAQNQNMALNWTARPAVVRNDVGV